MTKRVLIYSGLPGSGKSTLAEETLANFTLSSKKFSSGKIFSTDDYFIDEDGIYNYDPSKAGKAHADCFRKFIDELQHWDAIDSYDSLVKYHEGITRDIEDVLLIVDNTNLSVAEIAPYMMAASAYGFEPELVTVICGHVDAFERNTHGVPQDVFDHMVEVLAGRELPPWWKHSEVSNDI